MGEREREAVRWRRTRADDVGVGDDVVECDRAVLFDPWERVCGGERVSGLEEWGGGEEGACR